jgi:hypothetical protein
LRIPPRKRISGRYSFVGMRRDIVPAFNIE